jgi:hypothetical protein
MARPLDRASGKPFPKNVPVQQVLLVAHKIGESDQRPLRAKLPRPVDTAHIAIVNAKETLDEFERAFNRSLERIQQANVTRVEESERALGGEPSRKEDDEPI